MHGLNRKNALLSISELRKVRCLPLFSFFLFPFALTSQAALFPPGSEANELIDRLEIRAGQAVPIHSDIRSFCRKNAAQLAFIVDTSTIKMLSKSDRNDLIFLFNDNNEWLSQTENSGTLTERRSLGIMPPKSPRLVERGRPILRYFYKTPANFFEVNSRYFKLKINPVINVELSKAKGDSAGLLFQNRRGIELRGDIDSRLYFYTTVIETQNRLPGFANEFVTKYNAVPGNGRYKIYNSRLFNINNGYDFTFGEAYIGFYATRHVGIQLGHSRHFLGNGYRSLLLSDFSSPYFSLKINTQVWRFAYQNLFAELIPSPNSTSVLLPRKYMASHYLSYKFNRKLSVGLYETVLFHRPDHFEFQYLNPIILYRTIESVIGSPDNVLLGLNAKFNVNRKLQVYGQWLLDEFLFRYSVFPKGAEKGWWGNKQGIQFGVKYLNAFGIDHLDLQVEMNQVRPYTYAHFDSTLTNFAHYNQPLAHPLGANFREFLFRIRWQVLPRLFIENRLFYVKNGDDSAGLNFGSDWTKSNYPHPNDFGNTLGQGIGATILSNYFDASWQLFHNGFLDLRAGFRKKTSDEPGRNRTDFWVGGGFRMNVGRWKNEF